ncbi:Peptidoglycan/LPS O-acetylase OafA/YrhL, contains acyltransferase and SGNH-hydrolase domains [Hymenobacter gelipurpurascens]|uniref:Peptidoglycan/LPS O-acetylase OafA/YrhL, contains acyltransferase and SGNH-hydrolase domains n=1 Tax=Hymenobacter gelipurpurascens TaxID=89968 RepID=A0A212TMS0_9BACT|nr:acyltransferase [Hymenobacter gelipurpurascens]SNC67357.1 Peptidoglycan/LPS O-acetylase OafA/YrhL, contains acyltransferase and SGNH-hydrolase domains [Hymenobacter gelipurpurascens]
MSAIQDAIPIPRTKINYNLEALRGFAALVVVWHHALLPAYNHLLSPHYQLSGPASFTPSGHFAVLIFFLLSGYVIEISTKPITTRTDIGAYLKKRAVRLYPIYLVVLLFTLFVATTAYSWQTKLAHFTLLQGALSPVMMELNPSWSLAQEVCFYLLFLPLSFFRVPPQWAALGALLVGLINLALGAPVIFLTTYALGFTFWLLGAALARFLQDRPAFQPTYSQMLSALLLFVSLQNFNVFLTIGSKLLALTGGWLQYPANMSWWHTILEPVDFAYLPYCLFILGMFIGKEYPGRKIISRVLMLLPLITFRYISTLSAQEQYNLAIPISCYVASLAFYFLPTLVERQAKAVLGVLTQAAGISFALYLVHMPLLYVFARVDVFSSTPLAWLVRAVGYLALCCGLAYILEKLIQPFIKRYFT